MSKAENIIWSPRLSIKVNQREVNRWKVITNDVLFDWKPMYTHFIAPFRSELWSMVAQYSKCTLPIFNKYNFVNLKRTISQFLGRQFLWIQAYEKIFWFIIFKIFKYSSHFAHFRHSTALGQLIHFQDYYHRMTHILYLLQSTSWLGPQAWHLSW